MTPRQSASPLSLSGVSRWRCCRSPRLAWSRVKRRPRGMPAGLDTGYFQAPGDPLWRHTSGFAKTLCSAVFVTGLDAEFVTENVGFLNSPSAE